MLIIGCDFHPSVQQVAFLDTTTGRRWEIRLSHEGDGFLLAKPPIPGITF